MISRPLEFWDSSITQQKHGQIIGFFAFFLICQDPRSKEEAKKIQKCYHALVNWYAWLVEEQQEDASEIFEISHKEFESSKLYYPKSSLNFVKKTFKLF